MPECDAEELQGTQRIRTINLVIKKTGYLYSFMNNKFNKQHKIINYYSKVNNNTINDIIVPWPRPLVDIEGCSDILHDTEVDVDKRNQGHNHC